MDKPGREPAVAAAAQAEAYSAESEEMAPQPTDEDENGFIYADGVFPRLAPRDERPKLLLKVSDTPTLAVGAQQPPERLREGADRCFGAAR